MNALTFATAQILRVLPRAQITRVMGHLADAKWHPQVGRAVVGAYCRAYDVSLGECTRSEFHNFDAFFTRTLKHGARPLDGGTGTLVSPADGRVESMGPVDRNRTFMVKGRPYSVEELVGSASEARRYEGGLGCVVYLSPRDYHRVHAPVSGKIAHIKSIPGDYYPVNSIGLLHIKNLFARNRRVSIAIDNEELGRVTVVMVAAMIVGRITTVGIDARDVPFGDHHPDVFVEQGEEIGIFHLGSTAVVFVEERAHGRFSVEPGPVRMGQSLVTPSNSVGQVNGQAGAQVDGQLGGGHGARR